MSHDHYLSNPIADKNGMTKMKIAQMNLNRISEILQNIRTQRDTQECVEREPDSEQRP